MTSSIQRLALPSNPVRGPLNAAFFNVMDRYLHFKLGPSKRALFSDLPDHVVELGPGTGANLRYLRRGTRLTAIEPNPHMHASLRRNAARVGVELDLRACPAERLDLPDASADAVIATLVLCTVGDPAAALAEVRRVLRPGGRFICLEHVQAARGSSLHALQHAIRRPWKWAFEGCDLCRDTAGLLRDAGFRQVAVRSLHSDTVFVPIRPQIAATCVR